MLCCAQLSDSLRPHGLRPIRFLCPWDFPGKDLEWVAVPSPGDPPDLGIEPSSLTSPALAGGFFTTEPPEKPKLFFKRLSLRPIAPEFLYSYQSSSWSQSVHGLVLLGQMPLVFLFFNKLAPLLSFFFFFILKRFINCFQPDFSFFFPLLTITTVETWWFPIEFGFIFLRSYERTFWFLFLKWSCWLLSGIIEGQEWKPGYQGRDCRNSGERWQWLGQSGNSEHWEEWMLPGYVSETW